MSIPDADTLDNIKPIEDLFKATYKAVLEEISKLIREAKKENQNQCTLRLETVVPSIMDIGEDNYETFIKILCENLIKTLLDKHYKVFCEMNNTMEIYITIEWKSDTFKKKYLNHKTPLFDKYFTNNTNEE